MFQKTSIGNALVNQTFNTVSQRQTVISALKMLHDNIRLFLREFRFCKKFRLFSLLNWNSQAQRVIISNTRSARIQLQLIKYIWIVWIVVLVGQCYKNEANGDIRMGYLVSRTLQAYFLLGNVGMAQVYTHVFGKHASDLVLLINGHLDFQKKYCKILTNFEHQNRCLLEKVALIWAKAVYWIAIGAIFMLAFCFHWLRPCRSTLVGYWLLDECFDNKLNMEEGILKMLIITTNYLQFTAVGSVAIFSVSSFLILCTMGVCDHLGIFLRNSLHNVPVEKSIVMYRHIQLLVNLVNMIQQNSTVAVFTHVSAAILGIAIYFGVTLEWTTDNIFPILGIVGTGINSGFMIVVGVSGSAAIYSKSFDIIAKLKKHCAYMTIKTQQDNQLKETQLRRKFFALMFPMKIKLGPTNFVEAGTPLILLNGAIDIAVNLLLLGV